VKDINAEELKIHINEMREKVDSMELEASQMMAIARAIKAESYTLENRFRSILYRDDK